MSRYRIPDFAEDGAVVAPKFYRIPLPFTLRSLLRMHDKDGPFKDDDPVGMSIFTAWFVTFAWALAIGGFGLLLFPFAFLIGFGVAVTNWGELLEEKQAIEEASREQWEAKRKSECDASSAAR